MSALDDIIARDSAPQQGSALDAIIARDAGMAAQGPQTQQPPQPPQGPQDLNGAVLEGRSPDGAMRLEMGGTNPTWQTPNSVGMGVGDAVMGAIQKIAGATAWAANKIAPDSKIAKDFTAMVPQIQSTIDAHNAQYDASRQGQDGVDWGRLSGNVIGAAPLMAAAPEMQGMSLVGKLLMGAGSGAQSSLLMPAANLAPGETLGDRSLDQAISSGLLGAAGVPVMQAAGKAISGLGGHAQKALSAAGVDLTPGQILGGAIARTEDKLTSVPILGDFIKGAQQRSVNSLNSATYNKVLEPLGQKYSGPIGNEGVAAVEARIGDAYDNALSRMHFNANDPAFQQDILKLGNMAGALPQAQQKTFTNIVQTQLVNKLNPNGQMDGQTLKGVQSELSRIAQGLSGDPSWDNRQLGAAITEVRNAVEASLPRYNPADAVTDLGKANEAWANYVRLRTAAGSQGAMNRNGIFTAAQLNNAVRSADKSAGKGATARGEALMQDFSRAAQDVLGSKYPDSGTAGRLGLGVGALAGHQFLPAEIAGPLAVGVGGTILPYTRMGQKAIQTLLMKRPAGADQLGTTLTQLGSPLAPFLIPSLVNSVAQAK
jgi:hypothetical protein